MSNQNILQSLPIYIAAIAQDLNISVTFGGKTASCKPIGTKWQITIPLFDVNDAEARAAAYAYALHETGHVNYTAFKYLKELIASTKDKKEFKLKKRINNIFEDTYIERKLSQQLKGAFARLSAMRQWLQNEEEKKRSDDFTMSVIPLSSLITSYLYTYAFTVANNYVCYKAEMNGIEEELSRQLGDKFIYDFKIILNESKNLSNSGDSMALTDKVYDFLGDFSKELEQDDQEQQSGKPDSQDRDDSQAGDSKESDGDDSQAGDSKESDGDDSQAGDSKESDGDDSQAGDSKDSDGDDSQAGDSKDSDGDDSQAGDSKESDDDDSQAGDSKESDDDATSKDNNKPSSQGDDQSKPKPQEQLTPEQIEKGIKALEDIVNGNADIPKSDAGDALSKKLNQQSEKDIESGKVNPSDYSKDSKVNGSVEYRTLSSDPVYAKALIRSAERQSVFVRQRMQGLIAAKQRKVVSRKSMGKRAINQAGTRMASGDFKVFRQELTRQLTNTAITILLDDSGSMKNERGQVAAVATQAIIKALEPVNFVSTSVETFGTDSNNNAVYTVKGFNESAQICAERLSAHLSYGGGYTPLLTGLWSGLRGISQRKEARKVIIVITDGEPDDRYSCTDLIRRIRQSEGVEVFGIGIGEANGLVKPLFGDKYAINIRKIDELATEVFKLSEQILFH